MNFFNDFVQVHKILITNVHPPTPFLLLNGLNLYKLIF